MILNSVTAHDNDIVDPLTSRCDTHNCDRLLLDTFSDSDNVLDTQPTAFPTNDPLYWGNAEIWTARSDGAGSGLDADLLDGLEGSAYQQRVSGACASGSAIRTILADGSVQCQAGYSSTYEAGTGLKLTGTTFSIAPGGILSQHFMTGAVDADAVQNGSLGISELAFDPATQAELDAHAASGDHDARYPLRSQLSDAGTINDAGNPVDWTKLKGVPAGFADGVDADSGGDMTAVNAGEGLLGGATTGDATLSVDFGDVQRRVSSFCIGDSTIQAISSNGQVTCNADDDTTYTAGNGLVLSAQAFSVMQCAPGLILKSDANQDWMCDDPVTGTGDITSVNAGTGLLGGATSGDATLDVDLTAVQARVFGACPDGSFMMGIGESGAVVCGFDAIDGGNAELLDGLDSTAFSLDGHLHDTRYFTQSQLSAPGTINAAGNPLDWTKLKGVPAGFADGIDADSGGDITAVTAGFGLSGGATSGSASLAVDSATIQERVSGSCAIGSMIRAINQDGTVVCETDTGGDYTAGTGLNLVGNTFSIANGGVGSTQLASNSVTASKVAFNYAGSTSEGGAASNLACTSCVSPSEVTSGTYGISITGTAGGAPPTGAAGGDLSGTYPNPTVSDQVKSGYERAVSSMGRVTEIGPGTGEIGVQYNPLQPAIRINPGPVGTTFSGNLPEDTLVELATTMQVRITTLTSEVAEIITNGNMVVKLYGPSHGTYPNDVRVHWIEDATGAPSSQYLFDWVLGEDYFFQIGVTLKGDSATSSLARVADVTIDVDGVEKFNHAGVQQQDHDVLGLVGWYAGSGDIGPTGIPLWRVSTP